MRAICDGRKIKKHTLHSGVPLEDCNEQGTISTAHVDMLVELRKVICVKHRIGFRSMMTGHGLIEDSATMRIFAEVVESWHTKRKLEGCFSCPNRFNQLSPRLVQLRSVKHRIRTLSTLTSEGIG